MTYDHIVSDVDGPVCRITFDRPEHLNAVSVEMWEEFREALLAAEDDPDVRVVLLAGNGDAFCAGDDIQDIRDLASATEVLEYCEYIREASGTIERIATPVVAKVDGIAYGVGCEIAGLCDVTIATEDASFSLVEPKIGVSSLNGLFRFPDLIGTKPAREMMVTARTLDAAEAHRVGLVSAVATDDEVDDVVADRIDEIVESAPLAVELSKRLVNGEREGANEAVTVLANTFLSEDRIEGTSAFLEKRDADWQRD
ncbi:enoyl-CoA hydratase/isomerase family protein [Halorarius litoreus]|uniref:enoyl-CoA hydratase/isomerase family protein n=1 Tax=Halorarius litoreus TaxID=2962676 RepID=UPI0020CBAB1E|nr:enoyl-CoA hydratase/isomerase family protein [Halorarius litoreus]